MKNIKSKEIEKKEINPRPTTMAVTWIETNSRYASGEWTNSNKTK